MSVVIGCRTFNNNTTKVELHYMGLTSLPVEIGNLVSLRKLSLCNNKLTVLPVEIRNLVNLIILNLNINQLTSLPVEIGNLVNLQELHLAWNQLTSLPVEILNFINILYLDNTSYRINNIPNNTEFLIFSNLNKNLDNLPLILRKLYLHEDIDLTKYTIKLPFSCVIERF